MRVAVTGSSGLIGQATVRRLREGGHTVVCLDARPGPPIDRTVVIDLTSFGDVADALHSVDNVHGGVDAVVHLGAIPRPGARSDAATFAHNVTATANVFEGARKAGVARVVFASSETLYGAPFRTFEGLLPIDEQTPIRPLSAYARGKHLEEVLAADLCAVHPELSFTALRFTHVVPADEYAEYGAPGDDPSTRRWSLWAYLDPRDAAQAIERALVSRGAGFECYVIAASDSTATRPLPEMVAEHYPDARFTPGFDPGDSPLSSAKARRDLGFEPVHSWRSATSG